MEWHIFTIPQNDAHKRVDALCKMIFAHTSFDAIMKWIRKGLIKVNNHKTAAHYRLHAHDNICVAQSIAYRLSPNVLSKKDEPYNETTHEDTKTLFSKDLLHTRNIVDKNALLFLNEDILVYNKVQGELLFGKNSITHRLQEYYMKHTQALAFKPAPCHRLDTGTSGIVICALSVEAARTVSKFHKNNHIHKVYIALLESPSHAQLLTHTLYRNKTSKVTVARPSTPPTEKNYNTGEFLSDQYQMIGTTSLWLYSIDAVSIRTAHTRTAKKLFPTVIILGGTGGKTHQIRAQCAAHNTPLWGDVKYQSHKKNNTEHPPRPSTYYLHASTVLCHETSQEQILPTRIVAPIPKEWYALVQSKGHLLLRRVENALDRVSCMWEKERPADCNIDVIAWYSSALGGVIG